ncbi:hypothetical protein L198_06690 [Cryptococcus wingfieldii CBS 7118]|uniref:Uncharacterized protein n=1 Tax=Cryptococcus wingfieldii CBS 7118 TaxID=1295528 RepID=A0A1E3IIJ6_9TREE|nr:hypothetical protein L198_06690 [Cryptococcus wingfieldii CBS 7118]ODN88419.1 hypothetical protein L198_06690 [Cryptococcus wingfieldii CBS 7118]
MPSEVEWGFWDGKEESGEGWNAFDGVSTAEEIGSYETYLRRVHYALAKLEEEIDLEPHAVLGIAISDARTMNLKAEDAKPELEFESMGAFVDGVKEAMGSEGYQEWGLEG